MNLPFPLVDSPQAALQDVFARRFPSAKGLADALNRFVERRKQVQGPFHVKRSLVHQVPSAISFRGSAWERVNATVSRETALTHPTHKQLQNNDLLTIVALWRVDFQSSLLKHARLEMSDPAILLLLHDVRRKTLELLTGVSDRQARWSPPGLDNTILWHAGHSYILLEWLTAQALGTEPECPDGWFEMFSWQSRPETVPPERWPPLQDVVRALQQQHERLGAVVAELSDERLEEPVPGRLGHTARSFIVHALHDEACHGGEIWLLRKLLAAGHGG